MKSTKLGWRCFFQTFVFGFSLLWGGVLWADEPPANKKKAHINVLVLLSFHKEQPWHQAFEVGLRSKLDRDSATLYYEYLDASRFPLANNTNLLPFLVGKYNNKSIDFIVAESIPAANFVQQHTNLLPDTPRLLMQSGAPGKGTRIKQDQLNVSIEIGNNYQKSFQEMLDRVKPSHIYVPADTSIPAGKKRLQTFQEAISPLAKNVPVEYLTDLSMAEYKQRLGALPEQSAIYYLPIFKDSEGANFSPAEAVKTIAESANAPIFSYWSTLVGSDMVGGYVISAEQEGRIAGSLLTALSRGEHPVLGQEEGFEYLYNWEQLQRWDISESTLPAESTLINRRPSLFMQYRVELISAGLVVSILCFSVFALNYQVRRRTRALEQAKLTAERLAKTKSEFLANMSHEIRTPMNAILGLTYVLTKPDKPEAVRELAHKIQRAGRSLQNILNDVLDFSKIDAGKVELAQSEFDLGDVLDNVSVIMSSSAAEKKIELTIQSDIGLPLILNGDHLRLEQVLINLVGNAIKFTENGFVSLAIHGELGVEQVQLTFCVKDSGIGMTSEFQSRMFKAFEQGDVSTTRQFGGTGLGLAISSRLVTVMGGKLEVSSRQGEGTEFCFTLDFGLGSAKQVAEKDGMKVLIADDSPIARDALQVTGTALGWQITTVDGGIPAVEHALSSPKDLLVIDWDMPDLDGLKAARQVKEQHKGGPLPVIVMVTSYNREMVLASPDSVYVDAILEKPITPSALTNLVNQFRRQEQGELVASDDKTLNVKRLNNVSVLVVDDNEFNRQVAELVLTGEGASITTAEDGRAALNWLKQHVRDVDIILMDIQMPVMDGYAATKAIRADSNLKHLPIIALTAGAFESHRQAAKEVGMNDFIPKPFDVEQTVSTIQRVLGGPQGNAASTSTNSHKANPATVPLLDMDKAAQLWQDKETLCVYLQKFLDDHKNITFEMSTKGYLEARRIAHKLQGTAGALAMERVKLLAIEFQQACENGEGVSAAHHALDKALAETFIKVQSVLSTERPNN